jgi:hypothetical protein
VPVVIAGVLAAVLIFWILLCQPTACDVWLMLWQAAFNATMALLYISDCFGLPGMSAGCQFFGDLAWIAAGGLTITFFVIWLLACKPSECTIWTQLGYATIDANALLGLIYFVGTKIGAVIPLTTACLLGAVPAALGIATFVIGIIILIRGCKPLP